MKICEWNESDMHDAGGGITSVSAQWRAMQMLRRALETVNQAGLDGKKLSDFQIVESHGANKIGPHYEVYAKVTHKLKTAP